MFACCRADQQEHRVKFIIRHQCGYCQDDMYIIQLKRKKLPTPTLGGLSLYLKRGTQPKNNRNNLHRAVEIEKYPRTRYSRCWPFCIMYIYTSDEPAHVHLFFFFLSLVPAIETYRHAANSIPPNKKKRTMWSQLLISALVGALMSK